MGTSLVIGIVIYLLLIIVLTAWFLRLHLQKGLMDGEPNKPVLSGTDAPSLENRNGQPENAVRDDAPPLRPTETDLFPKKK